LRRLAAIARQIEARLATEQASATRDEPVFPRYLKRGAAAFSEGSRSEEGQ
jgi:hypothetical protein